MNKNELFNDIHAYCQTHAKPKIVQKYSRFFKEGYRWVARSSSAWPWRNQQE